MTLPEGRDLDEDKELKVKIPVDYHVKLHTLKVVNGQNISATVEQALVRYFDLLADSQRGERLEELSTETIDSLSLGDGRPETAAEGT